MHRAILLAFMVAGPLAENRRMEFLSDEMFGRLLGLVKPRTMYRIHIGKVPLLQYMPWN